MVAAVLKRIGITLLVLAGVCGLYSGYRRLWMETGWTWPFVVDDITMPSLWSIFDRLFESNQPGGPLLIQVLLEAAWFTAKEAAAGFLLGAAIGLAGGTVLHLSLVLRRGLLPFAVASQTVPILAIAPMVVIWLGGKGLPIWVPVAVIAAYLTFFPVTINTLRGLDSAQPRALELMRSYAAGSWSTLWKVKYPSSLPFVFSALKVAATASVVGAIIGELPSGIQDGLGGAILNFNQYYSIDPQALWATNIVAAALGIAFFGVVVIAEKLVVRAAPENVA
jgi:NitT/TauT family transport system permease protein